MLRVEVPCLELCAHEEYPREDSIDEGLAECGDYAENDCQVGHDQAHQKYYNVDDYDHSWVSPVWHDVFNVFLLVILGFFIEFVGTYVSDKLIFIDTLFEFKFLVEASGYTLVSDLFNKVQHWDFQRMHVEWERAKEENKENNLQHLRKKVKVLRKILEDVLTDIVHSEVRNR